MEDKKTIKSVALRALFIVAIVIVVIILAFAVVKIIPMAFSSFASIGNWMSSPFSKNKIEVVVNNPNLIDGDKFLISWNYKPEEVGEYKLTYKCVEDFRLILKSDADSTQFILCNTRYPLPNNQSSIELEADLARKNSFIDLPIEIVYIKSSDQQIEASGEVVITVQNNEGQAPTGDIAATTITTETVSTVPTTPAQTSTSSQQPLSVAPAPVAILPADLAVSNPTVLGNRILQFTVSNIGGRTTGNWFFTYNLPGLSTELSPMQPQLAPGQGIRYTLTFDNVVNGVVVINVDPFNSVLESTKANNILSVNIVSGSTGGTSTGGGTSTSSRADLEISGLEVGRMSGTRFIESNSVTRNQEAAVRFVVKNIGNRDSGTWRFEILGVPYNDDDEYLSSRQASLRPGESKEITVKFNRPDVGRYTLEVEIDSDDDVVESNKGNNFDSITLRVTN
ncbi:MAG TPA: CARDB domain-containing protein [Candidatus Paceibacterota bacterium]|nr:CARDB domain-containing protein [Candidatus Paceibacterota bacterium]